jgi:hypothetical protein
MACRACRLAGAHQAAQAQRLLDHRRGAPRRRDAVAKDDQARVQERQRVVAVVRGLQPEAVRVALRDVFGRAARGRRRARQQQRHKRPACRPLPAAALRPSPVRLHARPACVLIGRQRGSNQAARRPPGARPPHPRPLHTYDWVPARGVVPGTSRARGMGRRAQSGAARGSSLRAGQGAARTRS